MLILDDVLDRMNKEIFVSMASLIGSNPELDDRALGAVVVVRNVEGVADHAMNIAEPVHREEGGPLAQSFRVSCLALCVLILNLRRPIPRRWRGCAKIHPPEIERAVRLSLSLNDVPIGQNTLIESGWPKRKATEPC